MKKRILVVSVAILVLSIVVFYPRSLRHKYGKISIGDSYEKVESLLGLQDDILPALDSNQRIYIWLSRKYVYRLKYPFIFNQTTDEYAVNIIIQDNCVVDKYIDE